MNPLKYKLGEKEYTFKDVDQVMALFKEEPEHRKDIFEKVMVEQIFRDPEARVYHITGVIGLEFILENLLACSLSDSDYQYYGKWILDETILNSAIKPYEFCCRDSYEHSAFSFTPHLLELLQQHPSQPSFAWDGYFQNFHDADVDSESETKKDDIAALKKQIEEQESQIPKSWFERHQSAYEPEVKARILLKDMEKTFCPCSMCAWIKSGKILLDQADFLTDKEIEVFNNKKISKLFEKNWLTWDEMLSLTELDIRCLKLFDVTKLKQRYQVNNLEEFRVFRKKLEKDGGMWFDTALVSAESRLEAKDYITSVSDAATKLSVSSESMFAPKNPFIQEIRKACFHLQYDKFKELMKNRDENIILNSLLEVIKDYSEYDKRNFLTKFERLMIRLKGEKGEDYQLPLQYSVSIADHVPIKIKTAKDK